MISHPEEWVGLGFVSTIENAPGQVLTEIEGISSVAAQIAWGLDATKPAVMQDYLDDLRRWDLTPVGWAWCDAEDEAGARAEGYAHARIAGNLELDHFIANQEEEYDAHGDLSSPKFNMPKVYCEAFREILPDIEFAVTTLNRCGSNHQAMRDAGATLMPQAFFGEAPSATLTRACEHAVAWGWDLYRVRPLVQVYETRGVVPDPEVYITESAIWDVGVVPYILEQALGGAGRAALTALVPAITRPPYKPLPPANGGKTMIGSNHGVTAAMNRLRDLDPSGTLLQKQGDKWPPLSTLDAIPVEKWKAYDKLERSLTILVSDHDASI